MQKRKFDEINGGFCAMHSRAFGLTLTHLQFSGRIPFARSVRSPFLSAIFFPSLIRFLFSRFFSLVLCKWWRNIFAHLIVGTNVTPIIWSAHIRRAHSTYINCVSIRYLSGITRVSEPICVRLFNSVIVILALRKCITVCITEALPCHARLYGLCEEKSSLFEIHIVVDVRRRTQNERRRIANAKCRLAFCAFTSSESIRPKCLIFLLSRGQMQMQKQTCVLCVLPHSSDLCGRRGKRWNG